MIEFEKVKTWLTSSGLYVQDHSQNLGAVHSFYDVKKNSYGFLYPEITGYFISTMKFLYSLEQSPKILELATNSGNWLTKLFDENHYIIQGIQLNGEKNELAYSFDTSICAKALLDLYEISGIEKFKQYSNYLLDWLAKYCIEDDGTVKPIFDIKSNQFEEYSTWFMKKGCFGIKLAMPLLQFPQNENSTYKKTAIKICNTYKDFQNSDGSYSLHLGGKSINLHSHCYTLEGLIYAYSVLKNDSYLSSCTKALDWTITKINNDGSIPSWINFNYDSKACYPIAQLIRLLLLVSKINENKNYVMSATKLSNFLLTLQSEENDMKRHGGFYEEFHKTLFGWKKSNRINSWSSMFALQALYWIEHYDDITFNESIKFLF